MGVLAFTLVSILCLSPAETAPEPSSTCLDWDIESEFHKVGILVAIDFGTLLVGLACACVWGYVSSNGVLMFLILMWWAGVGIYAEEQMVTLVVPCYNEFTGTIKTDIWFYGSLVALVVNSIAFLTLLTSLLKGLCTGEPARFHREISMCLYVCLLLCDAFYAGESGWKTLVKMFLMDDVKGKIPSDFPPYALLACGLSIMHIAMLLKMLSVIAFRGTADSGLLDECERQRADLERSARRIERNAPRAERVLSHLT